MTKVLNIVPRIPTDLKNELSVDEILNAAHIEFAATEGDNTLHLYKGTNDCVIHWGDGSSTQAPSNGGNIIHNYSKPGTYHILITGSLFSGFYIDNQSGKEKYIKAHSLGKWSAKNKINVSYMFYGCNNLSYIASDFFTGNNFETVGIVSLAGIFRNCVGLTFIPANLFEDINGEDIQFINCFTGCTGITSIPANLFEKNKNATTFAGCFMGCTGLTYIPSCLFNSNTKANSFDYCFSECPNIKIIPIGLFENNLKAQYFNNCFYECSSLALVSDIFGTDYPNRFSGVNSVDFTNCFYRSSSKNTSSGIAPQLWNYSIAKVESSGCFGGKGNNSSSLSNYSIIPSDWK